METNYKLIETKSLTIGYYHDKERIIIQDQLNLCLKKGEFCCLIGPNGVGKSTLLHTISNQIEALQGDILINTMPLKSIEPAVLSKSMSIVTTEPIQIANLKVIDLVEMGRFPYTNFWGRLTEEDDSIVHESMQIMGIEELALRNYNELSDGEKQKTLIAKALAQNTSIILLDEPTAYLDFPSKVAILNDLKNIAHAKEIGIVLSTHDIELALKMADLIWLFPKNEKVISGIPEDLVINKDIQRIFTNEFLTFDLKTAHFTQITKTRELISITDNSIEMEWLKRALLRKGISTSPSNNLELKVHFSEKEKEFTLENNNNFSTYKSISEILQEIETQIKNKL